MPKLTRRPSAVKNPPLAPAGLRDLLTLLSRLLSSPAVRDALKTDPALRSHGDRTLAEWNRAFATREAEQPEEAPLAATRVGLAYQVAARVADHPGPVLPRAS
jgi:hypothetical protein